RPRDRVAESKRCSRRGAGKVIQEVAQPAEAAAAAKGQRTASVERNGVLHQQTGNVSACLESVPSHGQCISVLELIGRVPTALRKTGVDAQEGEAGSRNRVDGRQREQRILGGFRCRTKLKIKMSVGSAEFVHGVGVENVGPGETHILSGSALLR